MPYILVHFFDGDEYVRRILRETKTNFRKIVAKYIGEDADAIAFKPEPVIVRDEELASNMLRLEFEVQQGWINPAIKNGQAQDILRQFLLLDMRLNSINFGVWQPGYRSDGFAEHKPDPDVLSEYKIGSPSARLLAKIRHDSDPEEAGRFIREVIPRKD